MEDETVMYDNNGLYLNKNRDEFIRPLRNCDARK